MPRGNQVGEFPDKLLLFTRRVLFSRELFPSEVTKRLWEVAGMRNSEQVISSLTGETGLCRS